MMMTYDDMSHALSIAKWHIYMWTVKFTVSKNGSPECDEAIMLTQAGFEPPTKLLVKGRGGMRGRSLSRLENPSTPKPC